MNKLPLFLLFVLGSNLFVSTANAVKLAQQKPSGFKLPIRQTGDFDCGFCEFIVTFIYGYLTFNSTESEIVHTVDGICNYVSGSVASVCKSFIDEYGPALIYLLLLRENPATVCTDLGICNSTLLNIEPVASSCNSCNSFVEQRYSTLPKGPVINSRATVAALWDYCRSSQTSTEARKECQAFIGKHSYSIYTFLRQSLISHPSPKEELCTKQLHVCTL